MASSHTFNPLGIDIFKNTATILRPSSPAPIQINSARASFHSQHNDMFRTSQPTINNRPSSIVGFGGVANSPLSNRMNQVIGENRFSVLASQQSQENFRDSPMKRPQSSFQSSNVMYRSHQNLPSLQQDREQMNYQAESPYGMQQPTWNSNQDNTSNSNLKRNLHGSHPRLSMGNQLLPAAEQDSSQLSSLTSELISTLFDSYMLQSRLQTSPSQQEHQQAFGQLSSKQGGAYGASSRAGAIHGLPSNQGNIIDSSPKSIGHSNTNSNNGNSNCRLHCHASEPPTQEC
jgi:hypothetical protein